MFEGIISIIRGVLERAKVVRITLFPHPNYEDFSPCRLPPLPKGEGRVRAFDSAANNLPPDKFYLRIIPK